MEQSVIFTNDVGEAIGHEVEALAPASVVILTDSNTYSVALPYVQQHCQAAADAIVISIPAGDSDKNLEHLAEVWQMLSDAGANRHSLLINLGGGMITDLGGFAAATFKRGIRFINVPTTLLGAVDAATGGKTGINFGGLKNEVGVFAPARSVIVSTRFFSTLPRAEVLSGYAEMIKHALLTSQKSFAELMAFDAATEPVDTDRMLDMVQRSVDVKRRVVKEDPTETGIRKALNLGHTAGHAFESFAMQKGAPVPHGYAVAWGLIVSLVLSHMKLNMPTTALRVLAIYVRENYGIFYITCQDYPELLRLMHHDKKNTNASTVSFTLLRGVGKPEISQECTDDEIKAALDIYRDLVE